MIKITQEQAKALEIFKDYEYTLKDYVYHSNLWNDRLLPLTYFSLDQMARLLYEPNSYEIEQPKMQVGDWVTNTGAKHTFKVHAVTDKRIVRAEDANHWDQNLHSHVRWYTPDATRPATKEEIFWAELGRNVSEFREGDSGLTYNDVSRNTMVTNVESLRDKYRRGQLKGFYPAESFKEFPKKEVDK